MLKSAVFGQNHVGDKFVIGCGNHFGKDQRKDCVIYSMAMTSKQHVWPSAIHISSFWQKIH